VCGIGAVASPADASYGSAQGPALPTTAPFEQCPAVYLDPSCGYLIDVTSGGKPVVLQDPSVGFYEGGDDVLVGIQNDSSSPVSSIHVGVPGSGDFSFSFDGDGLCTPGGPPIPDECPFGPSTLDPYDYWGPDAELTPASPDDGTVTFPTPLQPGQYTYFSLEAPFLGSPVYAGEHNDAIVTTLTDGTTFSNRITDPAPVGVKDSARLVGAHAFEAPAGKKVTYRVYSDSACTKEVGKAAGGTHAIESEGALPESNEIPAGMFENNHVYYFVAEYEGDTKGNEATTGQCGEETATFGTPPALPSTSVTTNLTGSNGASGPSITVPAGTSVTDTAAVSASGAPQSGRVTYFVFTDPGCTAQVPGARLGGSSSGSGAYGPSAAVNLPVGTYYFEAIYSGNGKVAPARSVCGSEVLTVEPPCTCASIKTYLNHFSVFGADSTRLGMRLNVALGCTTGFGGCTGEVIVTAPGGAKFIDTAKHPKGVRGFKPTSALKVTCSGPCAATTIQRFDLTWLALRTTRHKRGKKTITTTTPIRSFLPTGRAKKSKVVTIETICRGAGGAVVKFAYRMTIKFDKHGQVSYKLSDLNGDGRPDGKQLKEF
jgi:hypothetical protein